FTRSSRREALPGGRARQLPEQWTQHPGGDLAVCLLRRVAEVVDEDRARIRVKPVRQVEEPFRRHVGHDRIALRARGVVAGPQPPLKRIGLDAVRQDPLVGREWLEARVQSRLPEVERAEAIAYG